MSAKKKITSVYLASEIVKKMKARAKQQRRSVSAYIEVLAEKDLASKSQTQNA